MSRKLKLATKLLAIFLSVLFVVQVLPMQTMAAAFSDYINRIDLEMPDNSETDCAEILCEVEEKRDEYTKVYKKADGSFSAIISKSPLHFMKNGVWEEINNSLVSEDGSITNLNNLYNICFPENIEEEASVHVQTDEAEISFSVNDIQHSEGVVENAVGESETDILDADKAIANTQSSLTYENVADNTNLQYIITQKAVKENVIVSNRASIKNTYSFTIETHNLTYTLNDDGRLLFKNLDGEAQFVIPKPVMTDSALAFSYDITTTVIDNHDGTIELQYSPSKLWTDSADRVYPVNIDPAILIDAHGDNWIEDASVGYNSSDNSVANSNGYNDAFVILADTVSEGVTLKSEVYTKIDTDVLSQLGDNIVFTDVEYVMSGGVVGGNVFAKKITSSYDISTVTYNTKPTLNSEIIDYYHSPHPNGTQLSGFEIVHFNITSAFNDWVNGETNNGFALIPDEDASAILVLNGRMNETSSSVYSTYLIVDYADVSGHNSRYDYHSQSVGRAGTGYVNDFTQALSATREDLSLDGNIMPVSISMNYNPAIITFMHTLSFIDDATETSSSYGKNWAPNFFRCIIPFDFQILYFTEEGGEIDFDIKETEDGCNYVEDHSGEFEKSGYSLELLEIPEGSTASEIEYFQITRPDGCLERFNSDGMICSVIDPEHAAQSITISYGESGELDYITDGVGRKFDYVYDSDTGKLLKVRCLSSDGTIITAGSTNSPLEVNYTYTNDLLTSVTYADGQSASYTYNSDNRLTSMKNIDGYKVLYTYNTNGKITNVKEQALNADNEYVDGNQMTFASLSATQVQMTDASGATEIYQFNSLGKLLYTVDNFGNYCKNTNSSGTVDSSYYISDLGYKPNSQNLLKNPSFETASSAITPSNAKDWSGSVAFTRSTSANAHTGNYVYSIEKTNAATAQQKQTVSVTDSGKYTMSAYAKSGDGNTGKLTLRLSAMDSSNTELEVETLNVENTNGQWQRYSLTVDAPVGTTKIQVQFGLTNSAGSFSVDDVQLEHSPGASAYNLLENGGFNDSTEKWTASDSFNVVNSTIFDDSVKALEFSGGVNEINTLSTTIGVNGKKDDIFSIGGWFKGSFVPSDSGNAVMNRLILEDPTQFGFTHDRFAQIELTYQYIQEDENGEQQTLSETITVPFARVITDWQFASNSFVLKGDCTQFTVLVRYAKNANPALVSNIELIKNEDAVVVNSSSEETTPEKTCPCANCEEENCTCTCESEALCDCPQCKRRNNITTSDSFGNTLTSSNYDGVKTIMTSTAYMANGNYIASQTNADNNTTSYAYNALNGVLNSITDAKGNTASYTYNAFNLLTAVSATNNSLTSTVNYGYNSDRLTSITHNGFTYYFVYDIWGQLLSVSVGNQTIISYAYGVGANRGRVLSSAYYNSSANPTVTEYFYNTSGNLVRIDINEVTKFNYSYDALGNVTQIYATDSRDVRYTDGRTDILDFDGNYIYSSYTNDDGEFIETIGGTTYTSKSYDSAYEQSNGTTTQKSDVIASNGKTVGTVSQQDWFGRTSSSVVKTESAVDENTENSYASVKTEYGYAEYSNNHTSGRITDYVNKIYYGTDSSGSDYSSYTGYFYTYDNNDNITAEYSKNASGTQTLRYGYVYDSLNQLVRVNDAVAQKTYVYTYDNSGNILTKTEYPYSIGELGTANNTVNYTYDSTWNDKLMSYGNTAITYDNIGNPTAIGNKSFTWSGRQLETYTEGNKTIEFSYDENGLRHRKVVKENNVVIEQYDYVWSDGKLVSQTYITFNSGVVATTNAAKFIYSDLGELQGFILNNSATYLYTKSLQGDITSIVNESGNTILNYTYDAWGKVSFVATSMNNMLLAYTLSYVSPFTYRGYCYDYDIELYYLQSRYYSADIGRFINADSTDYLGVSGTVLSYNLFLYCENNPVNYIDNSGNTYICLSNYKMNNWLQRYAKKIYNRWVDGAEYKLVNLNFAGIRFYMSVSVGTSLGKLKYLNIYSNKFSISSGNVSLDVGKTLVNYSVSTTIGYNEVKSKVMLGSSYFGYGISVISKYKNSKNKTLWYVALNLVWRISHWTSLGATALCGVIAISLPGLKTVMVKSYASVLGAISSYRGFIASLSTFVWMMQKIAT